MAEVAALCTGCPIPEMVSQISEVFAERKRHGYPASGEGPHGNHRPLPELLIRRFSARTIGWMPHGVCDHDGDVRERTVEIGFFAPWVSEKSHVIRIVLLEAGMIAAVAGIVGYFCRIRCNQGASSSVYGGARSRSRLLRSVDAGICLSGLDHPWALSKPLSSVDGVEARPERSPKSTVRRGPWIT